MKVYSLFIILSPNKDLEIDWNNVSFSATKVQTIVNVCFEVVKTIYENYYTIIISKQNYSTGWMTTKQKINKILDFNNKSKIKNCEF